MENILFFGWGFFLFFKKEGLLVKSKNIYN